MKRRHFLHQSCGLALTTPLSVLPLSSFAAPAFDKLNLYIPANVGGGWDATGRALGSALQGAAQAGEVVYDNKGGQGGLLGLPEEVARFV